MYDDLIKHADSIFSIGAGGKSIKKYLIDLSSEINPEHSIVEIGSGWGSGTAYLCLGLIKSKNTTSRIHSYDKWILDEHLVRQIVKRYKTNHKNGDNFYNEFYDNMKSFGIKIYSHIGEILTQGYSSEYQKIGLIVDDICSGRNNTKHMIEAFLPFCISGESIFILMDYYFFEKTNKYKIFSEKELKYQHKFFKYNSHSFNFLKRLPNSRTALYKYIGTGIKNIRFIEE